MRHVFGMNARHILPQCLLAIIPLIGDVIGVAVTRAYTVCEVRPPLCCVVVIALWEQGLISSCWNGNTEGWP